MDSIREEGKTVEEAISEALKKLNISREEAEIKVIDEGSKGIFGLIGGKNAEVEVKVKPVPVQIGKEFLEGVLDKMPVECELNVIEEETDQEQVAYNVNSPNLGIIIGRRGETLDALQYITSLVVNKTTDSYFRVFIDAEGYRERRKQTLERLARKMAQKTLTTGRKVMLEPMPPHERRIIHIALKGDNRVTTYSEGKEPYRRVLIMAQEQSDNN